MNEKALYEEDSGGGFYSGWERWAQVIPVKWSALPVKWFVVGENEPPETPEQGLTSKEGEVAFAAESYHACGEDLFCLNALNTHRFLQLFWLIRPLLRLQINFYENK